MAIDIKTSASTRRHGRKVSKSTNPYMKLLAKLYNFLTRRTRSAFCYTVMKRLRMSRRNNAPLSVSKLAQFMTKRANNKTAVIVGTVTDDVRAFTCPKMTVCALRFTETARARIEKAGGECISFDQLALREPKGRNTVLLRGPIKARVTERYFGKAPGTPGSTARPRVRSKGRKFERARGRRASRGFKN